MWSVTLQWRVVVDTARASSYQRNNVNLSTLWQNMFPCVQQTLMYGIEIGLHTRESKPDALSFYRRARQTLHAQANGHHLSSIGRDNFTHYIRHNCLFWQFFANTTTVRGFSLDSLDISAWLGSSFRLLSKRLPQWGRGIFIRMYCGNSCWWILEQGPWDVDWSRAMRQCTWPVLHYDTTRVTGENRWRQSCRCKNNHWYWQGCFWRSEARRTLS